MVSDSAPELKRILLVSANLPSNRNGEAAILDNVFSDYPLKKIWMLVLDPPDQASSPTGEDARWLPRCETVSAPRFRLVRRLVRQLEGIARSVNRVSAGAPAETHAGRQDRLSKLGWRTSQLTLTAMIPVIALKAARLIRHHRIEAVVAVQGPGQFLIASYAAHWATNVPLHVLSMDEWKDNSLYPSVLHDVLVRHFRPRIARSSCQVWAISPAMADDWRAEGATVRILRHSVDIQRFHEPIHAPKESGEPLSVGVLGTIYPPNVEPFRSLISAVEDLRHTRDGALKHLRISLFTTQSLSALEAEGVPPLSWLDIRRLTKEDVPAALAASDVLFLGLSFAGKWARIVEVAFPTKLVEYLAAGRPILVYAPEHSTTSRYVSEHGCGVVVDVQDPSRLRNALQHLLLDEPLRAKVSQSARHVAELSHNRSVVTAEFLASFARPVTR